MLVYLTKLIDWILLVATTFTFSQITKRRLYQSRRRRQTIHALVEKRKKQLTLANAKWIQVCVYVSVYIEVLYDIGLHCVALWKDCSTATPGFQI